VPSDPAAGAAGAARAGLAEATRPVAVLVPPTVGTPAGFLDQITSLLEQHAGYGAVAVTAGGSGFLAAGRADLLRGVGARAPDAFTAADAQRLDGALRAAGSRLLLVG
jgi:hypothetical protein